MSFNFGSIKPKKKAQRPTDPIEIFQSSKVSDASINDLWLAQGDALREWHKNRDTSDSAVVLNTGAGKTLVGLLIAQSLTNETSGRVVYACGSIQLVNQTADKAAGYGLPVTTYARGQFSNDRYGRGQAPCITTYHALFNGRSRFANDDVVAVILDDAHAAEHLLRSHFSLEISKKGLPAAYSQLVALFRDYHHSIGLSATYEEITNEEHYGQVFVPPFEVNRNAAEITRVLIEAGVDENNSTKFAWGHIRDHEDLCAVVVSESAVTLTPPVVPVGTLPYFEKSVRRIYLSATLTAHDAFARTFGRLPSVLVAPETTAGECERIIVAPAMSENVVEEDIAAVQSVIKDRKALIIVPTYRRAALWKGIAEPPDRNQVGEQVDAFRLEAPDSDAKLLLAARYDGVDLPGDTCRVLVIDDLPMGSGPLERFLWEKLKLTNTLRSTLASRIVQSFGRISRGMSDHGVVLLCGDELVRWLSLPKNAVALPTFLQKQLLLGWELSEKLESAAQIEELADACLSRDGAWMGAYSDFMEDTHVEVDDQDIERLTEIALAEAEFGQALWDREFDVAASRLAGVSDSAFKLSSSTGAWHSLWQGYATDRAGGADEARALYRKAHAIQKHIPSLPPTQTESLSEPIPRQINEIEAQLDWSTGGGIRLPKTLGADLALLNGEGSTNQTEEALRALGQYLGFDSSRPEKEHGTGPDVLWIVNGETAICIEAKTGKKDTSSYTKDDLGQLGDHVQWTLANHDVSEVLPIFVGPLLGPSDKANPPPDVYVVNLEQFSEVSQRLEAALRDSAMDAIPIMLKANLLNTFASRRLLWPQIWDDLDRHRLADL